MVEVVVVLVVVVVVVVVVLMLVVVVVVIVVVVVVIVVVVVVVFVFVCGGGGDLWIDLLNLGQFKSVNLCGNIMPEINLSSHVDLSTQWANLPVHVDDESTELLSKCVFLFVVLLICGL